MTNDEAIKKGYRPFGCSICNGTGQVADYGNGEDFYGPKECSRCGGNGQYWLTPGGRHVLYPGGSFC